VPYSVARHGTARRASNGRNGPAPVYAHGSAPEAEGVNTGELAIRAIPFEKLTAAGVATQLLTDRHRQNLAGLATSLNVPRRTIFYREDTPAEWVFMIAKGVVKSYRDLPSGKRHIAAFLFPGDVFGLAENGRFVNSTQAVTRAMVYRIPIDALKDLLLRDADLQFRFLTKVTHQLREAQRHTISVTRHTAVGKVAMFLKMLERDEHWRGDSSGPRSLMVPMTRADIADYLGLSPEAVSRTTSRLVRRGILAFPDRHRVRILDPAALDRLATAV
jgi:CRP/FNR family transcriptional regulator, anaerobic regulatory protein